MDGKKKTLLIIAGIAVVYIVVLSVVLKNKKTNQNTGDVNSFFSGVGDPVAQEGIIGELAVGNVVTFGSYEQDANFANGKEPLEWDVIAQDGDRYLLITHYVIDGKKFDDSSSDDTVQANENSTAAQITWAKSSIRQWLNNEFYATAFTKNDQALILQTHHVTTDFRSFDTGYLGYTSTTSGASKANGLGGADTDDQVFLLSYEEFVKYFQPEKSSIYPYRMQCGKAIVSPTKYARMQGVSYKSLANETFAAPGDWEGLAEVYLNTFRKDVSEDYEANGYICSWITRSPGCYTGGTAVLTIVSGYTCFSPGVLKSEVNGIRPAIWVKG